MRLKNWFQKTSYTIGLIICAPILYSGFTIPTGLFRIWGSDLFNSGRPNNLLELPKYLLNKIRRENKVWILEKKYQTFVYAIGLGATIIFIMALVATGIFYWLTR